MAPSDMSHSAGRDRRALEEEVRQLRADLATARARLATHESALAEEVVRHGDQVQEALARSAGVKPGAGALLSDLVRAHTAAVAAEQRLWDSVEAIPDGFAVFDQQLRLVVANGAYLAPFAQFPEVVPGIRYREILRICAENGIVDLDGFTAEDWVAAMLARLDRDPIPARVGRFSNGRHVQLLEHRTGDGDLVAIVHDITETIEREAAMREAQSRAEAASRAKSAFLANMSHEIRTPMNGVVGMAELLCDTDLTEEQRLYAETIRNSGEALLVIINDVLDFSKIEAGKLVLHLDAFDLKRAIDEVAMLMQPQLQHKKLELRVDYDMFLPHRFIGDAGRIRQVLTNLVGNAVKFTDSGHVLIRVVGLETEPQVHQLHLTVEDTGIGISPEHQERIFGEFSQVDDQANRRFEGTGLGLAITRRLIERMGGEIWVDSTAGEGSCFGIKLVLPVAPEAAAPEPAKAAASRAASSNQAGDGRRMRILTAEDNRTNRLVFAKMIKTLDVDLRFAANGREAVECFDDFAPDLIFMDISMPEVDGATATGEIRAREAETGARVPIVALTAHAMEGDERAFLDTGMDAYLTKPIRRAALIEQILAYRPAAARPVVPPEKP